jgi:hypothetical protein
VNWIVLAGIVLTFATSLVGFISTRRKVAEVHVLVNSQLHTVLERVAQLTAALHSADVPVPPAPPPAVTPPA